MADLDRPAGRLRFERAAGALDLDIAAAGVHVRRPGRRRDAHVAT